MGFMPSSRIPVGHVAEAGGSFGTGSGRPAGHAGRVTDVREDRAVVRVPGGRRLAYREYGLRAGAPLLYFPGTPSCAVEWLMWPPGSAEGRGFRVIAVDRPGLGGSGRQHGRRILDWPADVSALADVLGLGRFGVLGYSGGVPYALACAQLLPGRVTAAGLLPASGPTRSPAWWPAWIPRSPRSGAPAAPAPGWPGQPGQASGWRRAATHSECWPRPRLRYPNPIAARSPTPRWPAPTWPPCARHYGQAPLARSRTWR